MDVDQRSFTPLAITTSGEMGGECKVFCSRLALLISIKVGLIDQRQDDG